MNSRPDLKERVSEFLKKNPNPEDEEVHALAQRLKVPKDKVEEAVYAALSSFSAHGRAKEKGFSPKDAKPSELSAGVKVEKEHTDDPKMAKRIATDHLAEFPDYYTRLKKMEAGAMKKSVFEKDGDDLLKGATLEDGRLVMKALPKAGVEGGHKTPPKEYREGGAKKEKHYADPKNFKYPIDDEGHVRAAISYFSKPKNAGVYSPEQQKSIWSRIRKAAKKFGIETGEKSGPPSVEKSLEEASTLLEESLLKGFDRSKLTQKQVTVKRGGKTFQRKQWVSAGEKPQGEGLTSEASQRAHAGGATKVGYSHPLTEAQKESFARGSREALAEAEKPKGEGRVNVFGPTRTLRSPGVEEAKKQLISERVKAAKGAVDFTNEMLAKKPWTRKEALERFGPGGKSYYPQDVARRKEEEAARAEIAAKPRMKEKGNRGELAGEKVLGGHVAMEGSIRKKLQDAYWSWNEAHRKATMSDSSEDKAKADEAKAKLRQAQSDVDAQIAKEKSGRKKLEDEPIGTVRNIGGSRARRVEGGWSKEPGTEKSFILGKSIFGDTDLDCTLENGRLVKAYNAPPMVSQAHTSPQGVSLGPKKPSAAPLAKPQTPSPRPKKLLGNTSPASMTTGTPVAQAKPNQPPRG